MRATFAPHHTLYNLSQRRWFPRNRIVKRDDEIQWSGNKHNMRLSIGDDRRAQQVSNIRFLLFGLRALWPISKVIFSWLCSALRFALVIQQTQPSVEYNYADDEHKQPRSGGNNIGLYTASRLLGLTSIRTHTAPPRPYTRAAGTRLATTIHMTAPSSWKALCVNTPVCLVPNISYMWLERYEIPVHFLFSYNRDLLYIRGHIAIHGGLLHSCAGHFSADGFTLVNILINGPSIRQHK